MTLNIEIIDSRWFIPTDLITDLFITLKCKSL